MAKRKSRKNRSSGKQQKTVRSLFAKILSNRLTFADQILLWQGSHRIVYKVFSKAKSLPRPLQIRALFSTFPKHYGKLYAGPVEGEMAAKRDLPHQILWAMSVCIFMSRALSKYLQLRQKYYLSLLEGKAEEASAILKNIKDEFGVSLWMLRNEPFVAQAVGGLPANKQWLKEIQECNPNARVEFLAKQFSVLAEGSTTAESHEAYTLGTVGAESHALKPIFPYMTVELMPHKKMEEGSMAFFLECQNTNSLIDLHDGLLKVLLQAATDGSLAKMIGMETNLLEELAASLPDHRWHLLLNVVCPRNIFSLQELGTEILPILNDYSCGDFGRVRVASLNILTAKGGDLDVWELYVRTVDSLGSIDLDLNGVGLVPQSVLREILTDLYAVVTKCASISKSLQRLRKRAYQLRGSTLGDTLFAFCEEQKSNGTEDSLNVYWQRFRLLNQHGGTPQFSLVYQGDDEREAYLAAWEAVNGRQACSVPFISDPEESDYMGSEFLRRRKDFYFAQRLCEKGDLDAAVEILERISRNSSELRPFETEKLTLMSLICFRRLGDWKRELRVFVDAIVTNSFVLHRVDAMSAYSLFEDKEPESSSLALDLAIFYHWYSNRLPAKLQDDHAMYARYAAFSELGGWDSVLELACEKVLSTFCRPRCFYFLRYVCTPSTLENDWRLMSEQEKDAARIHICDFLAREDVGNVEEYQAEALSLIRNSEIRKLVQAVDESRIYVDVKRIVDQLRSTFEDKLCRFQSLRSLTPELRLENRVTLTQMTDFGSGEVKNQFEEDSAFLVFAEIFGGFAKSFLLDDEYGLDHFLSSRIRHGVLDNELRSVFENSHLVTKKSATGYLANDYFEEHLGDDDSGDGHAALQATLAAFSQAVDSSIERVKESWIRISFSPGVVNTSVLNLDELLSMVGQSGNGFDFQFDPSEVLALFDSCPDFESIDEFADYVFGALWRRTEECLAQLRDRIENDLCREFVGLVDNFEKDIGEFGFDTDPYLGAAIASCRGEITRTTAAVANWFRLSDRYRLPDYRLEAMLKTCLTIFRNRNPDYFSSTELSCDDHTSYPGETFLLLVDAIVILLGNILKHAPDEIDTTTIEVRVVEGRTSIIVANLLPSSSDLDTLKEFLDDLPSGGDRSALRTEGKSGFVKLHKILRDLSTLNAQFVAEIVERNVFSATILLNSRGDCS